ncbi:MAG: hypothetical protein R2909_12415 [Gemmatimonadales bacterium]
MLEALGTLFAPWADFYGGSTLMSAGTTAVHLAGMFVGGGFAIAADRATLRALRHPKALAHHLDELHAIHRPVLIGLGLTLLTGLMMLTADWEALIDSSVFWVKMGVFVLLLANGWWLQHGSSRLRRARDREQSAWRGRLGTSARVSAALWLATLVLGAVLPSL